MQTTQGPRRTRAFAQCLSAADGARMEASRFPTGGPAVYTTARPPTGKLRFSTASACANVPRTTDTSAEWMQCMQLSLVSRTWASNVTLNSVRLLEGRRGAQQRG